MVAFPEGLGLGLRGLFGTADSGNEDCQRQSRTAKRKGVTGGREAAGQEKKGFAKKKFELLARVVRGRSVASLVRMLSHVMLLRLHGASPTPGASSFNF